MAHTFLSLDMNLIPQETKDNIPTFWGGLFSNDNSRMLIDGYNEHGVLVHPKETLDAWLQWEENPQETLDLILSTSLEYTGEEYQELKSNPNSIWFINVAGEG